MSRFHRHHGFREVRYDALQIGISTDREKLYERINSRVDHMIESGLLNETRHLLDMGYSPGLKSMQSIGYRHMIEFIQRKQSWDETVRTLKRDSRRYAKRQMTWFRANPDIIWIDQEEQDRMHRLIEMFFRT
jgi:tRNA dimethylallyltransferase